MTTEERDREKKWLPCLGCGKQVWTDRLHRICKTCQRRNEAAPAPKTPCPVHVPHWQLVELLREVGGDSL